jgi:Asp-tRNA(Asn)/Glu-tRNA(Gln) amidotransferase C subunit
MAEQDPAGEVESVRTMAAASGIELDEDRAERLVKALARYREQMDKLDRLDLEEREPGVADPAAGR